MDFLATPVRRRALFTGLYLSEGAPIGFLWVALPTRLSQSGVPVEEIAALTAALVIPWTFKFLWAPLVDLLRTSRWTLKQWVLTAQVVMGATLLPLTWLHLESDFDLITKLLLLHAFAAATQDVAIDALCISVTDVDERGRLNGWMQAGMLSGRAVMGGGALLLAAQIGNSAVVGLLVLITTFSGGMLLASQLPDQAAPRDEVIGERTRTFVRGARAALKHRNTWIVLAFALVGPAAFKAVEVLIGPLLIAHGYSEEEVGYVTAFGMITANVLGALVGGKLADHFDRRTFAAAALAFILVTLLLLAGLDWLYAGRRGFHLPLLLIVMAFGIGSFTVSLYALCMDVTSPAIAAVQFSAFMGATNGCESWATYTMGQVVAQWSWPVAICTLIAASTVAIPLLFFVRIERPPATRSRSVPA